MMTVARILQTAPDMLDALKAQQAFVDAANRHADIADLTMLRDHANELRIAVLAKLQPKAVAA